MRNRVLLLGLVVCLFFTVGAHAAEYKEAPMLKARVEKGELPPVTERLPVEPVVVTPEKNGKYGGTLNGMYTDPGSMQGMPQSLAYHFFVDVDDDFRTLVPDLIRDWDLSEDGKTLTIYMREGMKWSDGVSFTTSDIEFWYEDVLKNKELTPVLPSWSRPGGELMGFEIIDDYTFQFKFAKSFPAMLYFMKMWAIPELTPRHFLEQYHIDYNPEANELAKEHGFDFWYQLYGRMTDWRYAGETGLPLLYSWIPVSFSTNEIIMERNPYYWVVDSEGNQLPYIDRIRAVQVSPDAYDMNAISKDIDVAAYQAVLSSYPLYRRNEELGDYTTYLWDKASGFELAYMFNLTTEDLVLRDVFQDLRFRQAMSLAINREEINQVLYFGRATPAQASVHPSTSYYEPEFGEAYAEYDVDRANQLLDEMGLKWDDSHTWRLRPDGKPLTIVVEHVSTEEAPITAVSELVAEYWNKVGIQTVLRMHSWDLWIQRMQANEHDATVWWGGEESEVPFTAFAKYFVPGANWWGSWWCPLWERTWSGKEGGEPLPPVLEQIYETYDLMISTVDDEERIAAGKEIMRIQAENLWIIGTVVNAPQPIIVSNRVHNVPEESQWGCDMHFWRIGKAPQWFIAD